MRWEEKCAARACDGSKSQQKAEINSEQRRPQAKTTAISSEQKQEKQTSLSIEGLATSAPESSSTCKWTFEPKEPGIVR